METGYAPTDDARLYYEAAGTGETVVLLHAAICDRRMWDAQMAAFAADYRTIRCDLRGYGLSESAPGDFAYVSDLRALLDHVGAARAHLIGCGLGGRVALEFALMQPERVGAMVLSAPALRGYDYSDVVTQYAEANDAAFATGDLARALDLDTRMWIDGPKRRVDKVDAAFRERARALAADCYHAAHLPSEELALMPRALDRLWQIGAPTLVLVGEYDVPDFINIAGMVAFGLDKADKAMISGAGHLLPMELPEVFNRQALTFLGEVTP
jgi:pimeloyl-ACP methyl ester carboxylesterase